MAVVVEPAGRRRCQRFVVGVLGVEDQLLDGHVAADAVPGGLHQVSGDEPGDTPVAVTEGVDAQQVEPERSGDQQRMGSTPSSVAMLVRSTSSDT